MNQRRNGRGLSLVESLVAIVIGGLSITALAFPLTAGVLLQRQDRVLDEARDLARQQMEDIRSSWSTAKGWAVASNGKPNDVQISISTSSWPIDSGTVPVVLDMTPLTKTALDLQDLRPETITNCVPAFNPRTPSQDCIVASYSSLTPDPRAKELTTTPGVFGINLLMPRPPASDQRTDYIGQIIVGRTPDIANVLSRPDIGNDLSRRVVIRIYAAVGNPLDFAEPPLDEAVRQTARSVATNDGTLSLKALRNGALAVLVDDIASPADYKGVLQTGSSTP